MESPGIPTPPEPSAPVAPTGPAGMPAAGAGDIDYAEHAQRLGMAEGELRTYLGPAQTIVRQYGGAGLQDFLNRGQVGGQPLGDNRHMLRAFGQLGLDHAQNRAAEQQLDQEVIGLAQQLGQRLPPTPPMPRLTEAELSRAASALEQRYLPDTGFHAMVSGTDFWDRGEVRETVMKLIEAEAAHRHRMAYKTKLRDELRSRLDQPQTRRYLADGGRASNTDLELQISDLRQALRDTDDYDRRQALKARLAALQQARYS